MQTQVNMNTPDIEGMEGVWRISSHGLCKNNGNQNKIGNPSLSLPPNGQNRKSGEAAQTSGGGTQIILRAQSV